MSTFPVGDPWLTHPRQGVLPGTGVTGDAQLSFADRLKEDRRADTGVDPRRPHRVPDTPIDRDFAYRNGD